MGGLRRADARGPVRRRRRLRRRVLLAVVLLLLVPLMDSYAIWMLKPTSMPFGARSVEWVRAEVPFGNSLVDEIEHIYYTLNAPKKGGPQLKSLPAVGLSLRRRAKKARGLATARSSRSSPTRCLAKGSGGRPGRRSTAAHRCW